MKRISFIFFSILFLSSCNLIKLKRLESKFDDLENKKITAIRLVEKQELLKEYEKLNWELSDFTMELQKKEKGSSVFKKSLNCWWSVSMQKNDLIKQIKELESKTPIEKQSENSLEKKSKGAIMPSEEIESSQKYSSQESQPKEKQWTRCFYCGGKGGSVCNSCHGTGMYSGSTCRYCSGMGFKNCFMCNGRGQILM